MKSILLIVGIILGMLIFQSYISNKVQIVETIYSFTPRKYTMNLNKINLDDDTLLSNKEFEYTSRIFDIDDTNELKYFGLNCTPNSFGFTKEESEALFPDIS